MAPDPYRHSVTAIIVAHDGSRWLPETLEALRSQTRRPDHIVAVDNDSRDRSAALLAEEFGAERMLALPRDTGYGAAVAKAMRHPSAGSPTSALEVAGSGGAEWLWLLHDDCAPAPDALERLLEAADENRYAAVLGPKLRDWLDRRILLEAGVTIDGAGRRETGLERREFDQGQHDGTHEVLSVSTACMLARRDVWDALGGLAPELPLFRDDVDYGWRVNASGHRVLAVTSALAYHAEAASRRRRRVTAVGEHPRRLDRCNALFVLFANLPGKLATWAALRNLFVSALRSLLFLLAKQPGNTWDEILAYTLVVGRPTRLWRARKRRSGGPRRSYYTLRKLMPPRWQGLRRLVETVGGFAGPKGPVEAGRHHAIDAGPVVEEEDPFASESGLVPRLLRQPAVLLALALAAVALVAERGLLVGGRLGGGALLPVSGNVGDLWAQYFSGWHATGLGSGVPSPPYVAVIAVLATVLLGKTWLVIDIILLGCVPLAGMSAYAASRWVVDDKRIRAWAGASYALLPVATGAVAAGRFGTAVVFVLLPVIGLLVGRMLRLGHRKATRAAWGAGGLLAVATAFVPLAWLLAAVLSASAHRLWEGPGRQLRKRLSIVLLAPLVLLLPWTPRLFTHPGLFLREAGLPAPHTVEAIAAVPVLLLQPGGPGMPPWWVTVGLVTAGLAALGRRDRRTPIVAGWALALLGMAVGVVVSRVHVTPPGEGTAAAGWPGVCMALAGGGVILAAAVGAERVVARLGGGSLTPGDAISEGLIGRRADRHPSSRSRRTGLRGRLAGLPLRSARALRLGAWAPAGLALVACAAPLAAAAAWVYTGVTGPLDRTNPPVLPPFIAAKSDNGTRPRTLVIRGTGDEQVSYTVLRHRAPLLGSSEVPAPPGLSDRVASVVAGLASGRHSGEVRELALYGIQFVVMPGPLDSELVATLDANPRLSPVSRLRDLAIWRLEAPAARLRLSSGGEPRPLLSGRIGADVELPRGPAGRTLRLAESYDSGWHATLNGRELPARTVHGWAQGFDLPSSGGQLVLSYSSARAWWVVLELLLAALVLVLALPGGGQQSEDDAEPLPRRERKRTRRAPQRARGHRASRAGPGRTATPGGERSRRKGRAK